MSIYGNYAFNDFYQRLIFKIIEEPNDPHFNRMCEGAFKEYKGSSPCSYNIARAFSEAKKSIETKISPIEDDWNWGNAHVNEYSN